MYVVSTSTIAIYNIETHNTCNIIAKSKYICLSNLVYTPCTQETLICLNGGTCINVTSGNDNDSDFECICTGGWQGIHCESDKDECEPMPCQNGGTCVHGLNVFECQCDFGYYGDFCENGKFSFARY